MDNEIGSVNLECGAGGASGSEISSDPESDGSRRADSDSQGVVDQMEHINKMRRESLPKLPPSAPRDHSYLNDWNPLKYDYESSQNLLLLDLDKEPLGFHLGITGQGVKSLSNTHCRFYSGYGKHCWKGTHCMYKHEEGVSGTDFSEEMKFGNETCNTITGLDNKHCIPDGISFYAQITHIVSPTEFFVLPSKGVECLCESLIQSHERDTHLEQMAKDQLDGDFKNDMAKVQEEMGVLEAIHYPPRQEGSEEYFKIREKLNEVLFENSLWRRQQSKSYIPGELVAVKSVGPSGKLIWWRAEMMECDVYDMEVGRELPYFKVRLIDVGTEMIVRADSLCKLPRAFCHTPALVYKCGLDGIVPVRWKWHKGAIEFFKSKVVDKDLLVTITEPAPSEGMIKTIESIPYKVEVGVFGPPGFPITKVAKEMADLGLGIPVNIFCERPKLNNFFTAEHMRLIGRSGRSEVVQSKSEADEVQKIEKERLKRILMVASGKGNEVEHLQEQEMDKVDVEEIIERFPRALAEVAKNKPSPSACSSNDNSENVFGPTSDVLNRQIIGQEPLQGSTNAESSKTNEVGNFKDNAEAKSRRARAEFYKAITAASDEKEPSPRGTRKGNSENAFGPTSANAGVMNRPIEMPVRESFEQQRIKKRVKEEVEDLPHSSEKAPKRPESRFVI